MKYLERFPEYLEFREREEEPGKPKKPALVELQENKTPEENLEDAYQKIRNGLAQDLLAQVKQCAPSFFEQLVVELLVKMGYGGSRRDAARVVGRAGDEGIDGIIDEDKLGLDTIYIQAKKWDGTVGRPEIRKVCWRSYGEESKERYLHHYIILLDRSH